MKVALFTNEFPPHIYGGAGVHVDFLCQELLAHAEVEVRCFGDQLENSGNLHVQGISPNEDILSTAAFQAKLFQHLIRNIDISAATPNADVIHCHTWYTHFAGVVSRQLLQVPLILTTHSLESQRPWKVEQLGNGYFLSRWIEQHAYQTADGIIAVSQQMKRDVVDSYGVNPDKVTVIHNGIDPDFYAPTSDDSLLERYGINPNMPFVLFVGRITRQKGISQLIAAAHHFDTDCQIVLCAGAPDTPEIAKETEELIAELQQARSGVILISEMLPREQVRVLYSKARVFACPSLYEPFGIINLEALSCETPVVASAVGGIPEILTEGETGFLIPLEPVSKSDFYPKNPESFQRAFAEKVNVLLRDEAKAVAMGKAGRKRVIDHFSWRAIAKQTFDFYRSVQAQFKPEQA